MSVVAHFFMSVRGSKFHERLAHFFVDIYKHQTMAECLLFQGSFKLGAKMMIEIMDDR